MSVETVTTGAKNQREAFRAPTQAELMKLVNSEPNARMSYIGPSYWTTTHDIEDCIFSELVDGPYHLHECIAVTMYPVIKEVSSGMNILAVDKNRGEMYSTAVAIFQLPNGKSDKNNVWRLGKGGNGNGRLGINVQSRVGQNGQFGCSQDFKKALINFADDSAVRGYNSDSNYDIVIDDVKADKTVCCVKLDVMRMIQFAVGVTDPNINFSVTGADYIEDGRAANISIQKFVDVVSGSGRRNGGNIDINALREALRPAASGRGKYNGGNRRRY